MLRVILVHLEVIIEVPCDALGTAALTIAIAVALLQHVVMEEGIWS